MYGYCSLTRSVRDHSVKGTFVDEFDLVPVFICGRGILKEILQNSSSDMATARVCYWSRRNNSV